MEPQLHCSHSLSISLSHTSSHIHFFISGLSVQGSMSHLFFLFLSCFLFWQWTKFLHFHYSYFNALRKDFDWLIVKLCFSNTWFPKVLVGSELDAFKIPNMWMGFMCLKFISYLLKIPPSSEALRHSGGDRRRLTSAMVTLYFEVELSRESLPGTEQNRSVGFTTHVPPVHNKKPQHVKLLDRWWCLHLLLGAANEKIIHIQALETE